jgi:hypothetical protein
LAHAVTAWLRRADRAVVDEAQGWGIAPAVARAFIAVPPLAAIGLALTVPHPNLYHFLIDEDHVIEWSQFFAILIASGVFVLAGRRCLGSGRRRLGALLVLVGIGAFIVAGEEISWGQRILGIATPEALTGINHQGETNIHNSTGLQRVFNIGELLVGLYGFAVPLLWASRTARERLRLGRLGLDRLLIPPLCLGVVFFMPFAYRSFRAVLLPTAGERITEFGELPELTLYVGILVTGLVILRALRSATAPASAPR